MPAVTRSDLLLLADGRLPAGAHAHSGGLEDAVVRGDVDDLASMTRFLEGLLDGPARTALFVAAASCSAWSAGDADALVALDVEESARTPSASMRRASRAQGRQLLRAAGAIWPDSPPADLPALPHGPHLALAQGVVAARLGLGPSDAARLSAYGAVGGPATAAVRLLGLDPFAVHAAVARVLRLAEPRIAEAASAAGAGPADLPAGAAPLLEIGAELHRAREIRMFAS